MQSARISENYKEFGAFITNKTSVSLALQVIDGLNQRTGIMLTEKNCLFEKRRETRLGLLSCLLKKATCSGSKKMEDGSILNIFC